MANIFKVENSNSNNIFEEIKSLFYLIALALAIRILIFEPFHIPSGSMRKTLVEGDYVFSTKYSYGYSKHSFIISPNLFSGRILDSLPDRGDIVIFRPPHKMHERYIKRLIGLPGEKVQIKDGIVFINDKEIRREFTEEYTEAGLKFKDYTEILPSGRKYKVRYINQNTLSSQLKNALSHSNNIGPFFVPENHYFFLGDNRDQSGDSRFELGFVPFENFISKAQFVFFSFGEKLWLDDSFSIDQITQIWKWITSFKFGHVFDKIE